jgi:Gas vesicle protein G
MGLISGLLTLPLAPLRGTLRVADMLEKQAENELYDESAILASLAELETAREAGEIDEEEAEQAENELVEWLFEVRAWREETRGRG